MPKSSIAPKFDQMRAAAGSAFDVAKSLAGTNISPQLRDYKKLSQANFQTLADVYGADVVADYIKHMEAERMVDNA